MQQRLRIACADSAPETLMSLLAWCGGQDQLPDPGAHDGHAASCKMLAATAVEALVRLAPEFAAARPGIRYVLSTIQQGLADVLAGKGIVPLALRRDDWVSERPSDRQYLAGGRYATRTFQMFRRSLEALCRHDMTGGDADHTRALAASLGEAVDRMRRALEDNSLTLAAMAEHDQALRVLHRENAMVMIRRQLGVAAPRAGVIAGNDAGNPLHDAVFPLPNLTERLLSADADAPGTGAAVDLLAFNLRTVVLCGGRAAVSAEMAQQLGDLVRRAGGSLSDAQLNRLGDAMQKLGLSAWGTCRKILDTREALALARREATRDLIVGRARPQAEQAAVRRQTQKLLQAAWAVDADVEAEAARPPAVPAGVSGEPGG